MMKFIFSLLILVVTGASAQRVVPVTYGFSSKDPFISNRIPPMMETTVTQYIVSGTNIIINFPQSAQDKYIMVAYPQSEGQITSWTNAPAFGSGLIPGQEFRLLNILGTTYIVSRTELAFDYTKPLTFRK